MEIFIGDTIDLIRVLNHVFTMSMLSRNRGLRDMIEKQNLSRAKPVESILSEFHDMIYLYKSIRVEDIMKI